MVRFQNVGMRYSLGPEVLRDISFTLEAGSFTFLTGHSGAGKSSLLRLMYLAQRPSRGVIHMFNRDVVAAKRHELPALRRKIGVVFQDFRLLDHLSTFDNAALPLRIAGFPEDQVRRHTVELLTWVGLGDRLDSLPETLSGGEQQRVAIARAVIGRPDLLLADEPTGNVDDELGLRLMRLFIELNRSGTTVVVATHDQQLIESFHRPVLRLEQGGIVHVPRTETSR